MRSAARVSLRRTPNRAQPNGFPEQATGVGHEKGFPQATQINIGVAYGTAYAYICVHLWFNFKKIDLGKRLHVLRTQSAKTTYALKAFADTLVAHHPPTKRRYQNNRRCNLLDASLLHPPQIVQVFHALRQQLLL